MMKISLVLFSLGISNLVRVQASSLPNTSVFRLFNGIHDHAVSKEAGVGRALVVKHDARNLFGGEENVAEAMIVTLPNIGDVTFTKTSFSIMNPTRFEPDLGSDNTYTYNVWSGKIDDNSFSSSISNFILSSSGDLFCNIKMGTQQFKCTPCNPIINNDSCAHVTEISSSSDPKKPEKLVKNAIRRALYDNSSRAVSYADRSLQVDDGTVIDIMITYTAAVIDYFGSEDNVLVAIITAIVTLNLIYANSGIDLVARLVAVLPTTYEESGDSTVSFDFLKNDFTVTFIRQFSGSDLVTLLTTDNDTDITSDFPNLVGDSSETLAYSVISAESFQSNIALPVAYGYNFGCDYDFENSLKDRVLTYAYGYQSPTCSFHTVMGTPCDNSVQLNLYSTPNVIYENEQTGDADTADCARVITEYKLLVSQYMDSTTPTLSPTATPTSTPTAFPSYISSVF